MCVDLEHSVRVPILDWNCMVATTGYRTRLTHPEQSGDAIVSNGLPSRMKAKNARINGLMRRVRAAEESPACSFARTRSLLHKPNESCSHRLKSIRTPKLLSSEELGLKRSVMQSHAYASARTAQMVRNLTHPRFSVKLIMDCFPIVIAYSPTYCRAPGMAYGDLHEAVSTEPAASTGKNDLTPNQSK